MKKKNVGLEHKSTKFIASIVADFTLPVIVRKL